MTERLIDGYGTIQAAEEANAEVSEIKRELKKLIKSDSTPLGIYREISRAFVAADSCHAHLSTIRNVRRVRAI